MAAEEGVGRIGHFEAITGAIWVVEGGINIGYRLTLWIMPVCAPFSGSVYVMGYCYA